MSFDRDVMEQTAISLKENVFSTSMEKSLYSDFFSFFLSYDERGLMSLVRDNHKAATAC